MKMNANLQFIKRKIEGFSTHATLYEVSYLADGLKVTGYLAMPNSEQASPLIVYCRGGIWRVGMTRLKWLDDLTQLGFAVFAPFYRGNRGGEGFEDFGDEDREDVYAAVPYLLNEQGIDHSRMYLFGFSRGAIMAMFAAFKFPEVFRKVVVWGGVADLSLTYEERVDLRKMLKRVIGGTPSRYPERYRVRSPLFYIDQLQQPLLIIHGNADVQVGVEHAVLLAKACTEHSKEYELWLFQEAGHFLTPELFRQTLSRMCTWLES